MFLCFTLTSTAYLAWLYHLLDYTSAGTADVITMVGGYSFQALGVGIACILMKSWPRLMGQTGFIAAVSLHLACAAVALFGNNLATVLSFGFAMNVSCGLIAAFYLLRLVQWVPTKRRGTAFGGGYACSVVVTWLLSMTLGSGTLGMSESLIACATLSLAAIGLAAVWMNADHPETSGTAVAGMRLDSTPALPGNDATRSALAHNPASGTDMANRNGDSASGAIKSSIAANRLADLIALAGITVLLLSLVKNIGFGFPASDLAEGVSLESSRLLYAVGLVAAGIVADHSRRQAALCCVAALVVPFACLALTGEPIPGTIMWAIDYLFYGFFSVYRVVLFADIAEKSGHLHYAGYGLMFGRIGDALGTAICLSLADSTIALVIVAAVLFAATIFAFYRLFQNLYASRSKTMQARSESQVFEDFASKYELSAREREVLRLVLAERTNSEAAAELFVAESTVKFHVRNVLKKTGCKNRLELIARYSQESRY